MAKYISHIKLDDTMGLTECHDGFYLYDKTRGMNIAMHAKTKDEAFFQALKYYQKRLIEVENNYKTLKVKVDSFVNQFIEVNQDDEDFLNSYR